MLTDPNLRSKVDQLWDKLWSGGLSNPLDAIEQFSYLLFLKRLDDEEDTRERQARRRSQIFKPRFKENHEHRDELKLRWREWTQFNGEKMLKHVRDYVFPFMRELGQIDSSFGTYMQNAEFKITKPSLLVEATKLIDQLQISQQNQDVQGDLYEYMLNKLSTAGRNGQFRTPRHIIRMMVKMINPQPMERIGDLAAGTAGFLVNTYQYILAQRTPSDSLLIDEDGDEHNIDGSLLTSEEWIFLQNEALRGYDNDSGMTLLRIGSMNLMLHGVERPHFYNKDTLSRDFDEPNRYDVVLMNPPFKGAIDKTDVNIFLPDDVTKTELLFLHQILRSLDVGGRAAVIVPDGVLFSNTRAHISIRQKLIEENRLDGVISMPSGIFRPYSGVSTAVLLFTKGGVTDTIWFYNMGHDGFTLDDKRIPIREQNDIPDILHCWQNRGELAFAADRLAMLEQTQDRILPLHQQRLQLEKEIHRLYFEEAIAQRDDLAKHNELSKRQTELETLMVKINACKVVIDQLSRQFFVTKKQVRENRYDLSANQYRPVETDAMFFEDPNVTLSRIRKLEELIIQQMEEAQEWLGE